MNLSPDILDEPEAPRTLGAILWDGVLFLLCITILPLTLVGYFGLNGVQP